MVALGSAVIKRVVLQVLSYPEPTNIRVLKPETEEGEKLRHGRSGGMRIVPPTECCSLSGIAQGLEKAGYLLRDALCRQRYSRPNAEGKYSTSFIFAPRDLILPAAPESDLAEFARALEEFCGPMVVWRVRAYLNPYCPANQSAVGFHTVQIVMDHRHMLNGNANRGDHPPSAHPNFGLQVVEGELRLVAFC